MSISGASPSADSRGRSASAPGILTFVIADLALFAMLFTGFMIDRSAQLALFNRSAATLDFHLGILNMLILVSSGVCVVFAVTAAREGRSAAVRNWIFAAFLIGAGFGICKFVEYRDKFAHGIGMQTNDFYMYYFALTGAHLLHFIGGMMALAFIWLRSFRQVADAGFCNKVEAVGLYWHMVDLLWIFIFPLLYVIGLPWHACR